MKLQILQRLSKFFTPKESPLYSPETMKKIEENKKAVERLQRRSREIVLGMKPRCKTCRYLVELKLPTEVIWECTSEDVIKLKIKLHPKPEFGCIFHRI